MVCRCDCDFKVVAISGSVDPRPRCSDAWGGSSNVGPGCVPSTIVVDSALGLDRVYGKVFGRPFRWGT